MSEKSDQEAIKIAFQAALAAREETFLARYPRKLKLFAVFLLLVGLSFPLWLLGEKGPSAGQLPETHVIDEQVSFQEDRDSTTDPAVQETKGPQRIERGEPRTETEIAAAAVNDADDPTLRMAPAPDADLAEETTDGYLPKIGKDGRKPWQVYARPFDRRDPRPRIALVVGDLGLSRIVTDSALRRLPPDITLVFDAQSDSVGAWLERARHDGHETLLSLPMEPLDYPRSDPGPNSLLTSLPNSDNLQRFLSFLKKGVGYVGVTSLSGSRFVADMEKIRPVMETVRERGLIVLDAHMAARSAIQDVAKELRIPMAVSTRLIDSTPTPQAIDAALAQLEQTAKIEGEVVAMASPLPVTFERIESWAQGLASRGIVLVPLSAVVH